MIDSFHSSGITTLNNSKQYHTSRTSVIDLTASILGGSLLFESPWLGCDCSSRCKALCNAAHSSCDAFNSALRCSFSTASSWILEFASESWREAKEHFIYPCRQCSCVHFVILETLNLYTLLACLSRCLYKLFFSHFCHTKHSANEPFTALTEQSGSQQMFYKKMLIYGVTQSNTWQVTSAASH